LTYVANPETAPAGAANLGLSGNVTGFVATDTLANSTIGTLTFTTPATTTSPAGQYAINGSGLLAIDYTFTQATTNQTALIINPTNPPNPGTQLHTLAVMAFDANQPPPPPGNNQPTDTNPPNNPPPPPPGDNFADAGTLNDIAPTAGGPDNNNGHGPNDDTQTDTSTTIMFQSMGHHHAEPQHNGNGNHTLVNGMLTFGQRHDQFADHQTQNGVPGGDVEFSNWGNEAFWQ
jgi:hypothetical protein